MIKWERICMNGTFLIDLYHISYQHVTLTSIFQTIFLSIIFLSLPLCITYLLPESTFWNFFFISKRIIFVIFQSANHILVITFKTLEGRPTKSMQWIGNKSTSPLIVSTPNFLFLLECSYTKIKYYNAWLVDIAISE